jgi:hypothetical protein
VDHGRQHAAGLGAAGLPLPAPAVNGCGSAVAAAQCVLAVTAAAAVLSSQVAG